MAKKNFFIRLLFSKKYLRIHAGMKSINLPASSSRLIMNSKAVFQTRISSDFADLGLNKPSPARPPISIVGYDLIAKGTFKEIYASLGSNFEKMWLSQGQVIDFCSSYSGYLCQQNRSNAFLIKKDESKPAKGSNLFVVLVAVGRHLSVDIGQLDDWLEVRGECHRIFCPQL